MQLTNFQEHSLKGNGNLCSRKDCANFVQAISFAKGKGLRKVYLYPKSFIHSGIIIAFLEPQSVESCPLVGEFCHV